MKKKKPLKLVSVVFNSNNTYVELFFFSVILAPFGLEGTLTGREWSDADAGTARLLDAWRQLYPLEQGCGAVEVTVTFILNPSVLTSENLSRWKLVAQDRL